MSLRHLLRTEPLSAEAFKPYGDVIEANDAAQRYGVNRGDAMRYHDLAKVDVLAGGGRPLISNLSRTAACLAAAADGDGAPPARQPGLRAARPAALLGGRVVSRAAAEPRQLRCFMAAPGQGINYARGTWHHPLLALQATSDFLVVDRGGPPLPANCDEHPLESVPVWVEA